jgi:hypothetical protein
VRPRYAFAVIALASGVALAAGAGMDRTPGTAAAPGVVLGVADEDGERWLVQVAPRSLRPLPGRRLRLEAPLEAWSRSPGGSRLAAVSNAPVLRLIDVERMRTVGHLPTRAQGSPVAVVWPRPGRLWIVFAEPEGSTNVVTVDPIAQRVVARRRLDAGVMRVAQAPDGPVLLLAPRGVIGPARLVSVDSAGAIAEVPLDGVSAGVMPTEGLSSVERVRAPALAVDASRQRAYVLSSRPYALEIDLRRRRVSGHRLVAEASPLDRLRELIEPSAEAGGQVGPARSAAWIGEGRIALSGHDADAVLRHNAGIEADRRPAGLHVVDTSDWSVRTLDERASSFVAASGLLLTRGPGGLGLVAYSPDGHEAFRVLGDRHVEIAATAGSLAYVRTAREPELHVVDLERERVVGTAPGSMTLLP